MLLNFYLQNVYIIKHIIIIINYTYKITDGIWKIHKNNAISNLNKIYMYFL